MINTKKDFFVANLSGGKDSSCMVLKLLEEKYPVDLILFCDTQLEFFEMYNHLDKFEQYIKRYTDIGITRIKPEKPFEYYFSEHEIHHRKNSAYNEKFGATHKGYGWAGPKMRWCTNRLKTQPRERFLRELRKKYNVIEYVGIAADEQYRLERKNNQRESCRHPLVEWGMTEADCLQYCYDRGFDWGGLYEKFSRVSCWCCPLQPLSELRILYHEFPALWEKLKQWDNQTFRKFRADYSVIELEQRFKLEDEWKVAGRTPKGKVFFNALKEQLGVNVKKLTLGSLFDGSGGFPLGGLICGIEPIWSSEILPFAIRVTTKRLPQVKHYGDISKLNGAELPPVDIITFGSPCQSVSIAGRRDGIKHTAHGDDVTTRSGLFFEAIRIIKEMRCATNDQYPRYIVFENVAGIFSSSNCEDFRTVLEEICSIKETDVHIPRPEKKWHYAGEIVGDGYSVAWRTLDAQYFNVPQRRARCFLVGDFGGTSAAKVLFESEGLSGYSSESCSSWKETAAAVEKGTRTASGENESTVVLCDQGGNRIDVYDNMTATLRSQAHHPPIVMESAGFCTEHSAKSRSIGYEKEVSPTLRAGTVPAAVFENHSADTRYTGPLEVSPTVSATYGTGGNNQPFVVESKAFAICSKESNAMKSDNPESGFYETDTARTIDTSNQSPVKNQGGIAIVENIKSYDVRITSEGTKNARQNVYETETSRTIDTGKNSPDSNQGGIAVVSIQGSMIGRKDENGPQGSGVKENVSFSLTASDKHCVAYGIDRAAFNQGQNALYNFSVEEEIEPTMVAKEPGAVAQPTYCTSKNSHHTKANVNIAGTLVESDYKDPPVINDNNGVEYIVRRLTPKECAKLMGFSPDWCSDLGTENPTAEDIVYWREIFNEYNRAIGKNTKPKSDNQIIKWLKNPHSDSAEYAMWGNGVVLTCVCFVLSGIVYYNDLEVNSPISEEI